MPLVLKIDSNRECCSKMYVPFLHMRHMGHQLICTHHSGSMLNHYFYSDEMLGCTICVAVYNRTLHDAAVVIFPARAALWT
jgi:hypothetical protein